METDGPAALRRMIEMFLSGATDLDVLEFDGEKLASDWQAERAQAAADRVTLDRLTAAAKGRGMVSEMADMAEVAVLVCGLYDRAELAEAALAQARALLTELYDDSPCRFDHHGHCQEHNSMTDVCIMRRIAAALSAGAR